MLRIGRVVFTWKGCRVVNPTQKGDVEEEIVHFGDICVGARPSSELQTHLPNYFDISTNRQGRPVIRCYKFMNPISL